MQYGDLSNKIGSAVIINADLLGTIESKYLGMKKEFVPYDYTRSILYPIFENMNIYITCQFEYEPMYEKIEAYLDKWHIPYTHLYRVENGNQLANLVEMEHVVAYVYTEKSNHKEYSSIGKHFKIPHLLDIYKVLNGSGNTWKK